MRTELERERGWRRASERKGEQVNARWERGRDGNGRENEGGDQRTTQDRNGNGNGDGNERSSRDGNGNGDWNGDRDGDSDCRHITLRTRSRNGRRGTGSRKAAERRTSA